MPAQPNCVDDDFDDDEIIARLKTMNASTINHLTSDQNSEYNLPKRLGKFNQIHPVDHGGFGIVCHAIDEQLGRPVAMKFCRIADNRLNELSTREGQTLASNAHENIVHVYEIIQHGNQPVLVMEWIDGWNLDKLTGLAGPLPEQDVCQIGLEIVKALQVLHRQKKVHRDIKPGNVLISRGGRIKLIDFGLTALKAEMISPAVRPGGIGSQPYMAPEQAQDPFQVDYQADIYSLGITLYRLLNGRLPDGATDTREELASPALSHLIDQMTKADLDQRANCLDEIETQLTPRAAGSSLQELASLIDDGADGQQVTHQRIEKRRHELQSTLQHLSRPKPQLLVPMTLLLGIACYAIVIAIWIPEGSGHVATDSVVAIPSGKLTGLWQATKSIKRDGSPNRDLAIAFDNERCLLLIDGRVQLWGHFVVLPFSGDQSDSGNHPTLDPPNILTATSIDRIRFRTKGSVASETFVGLIQSQPDGHLRLLLQRESSGVLPTEFPPAPAESYSSRFDIELNNRIQRPYDLAATRPGIAPDQQFVLSELHRLSHESGKELSQTVNRNTRNHPAALPGLFKGGEKSEPDSTPQAPSELF